ncbi:MAG: 4'-phosphopantetheinyl transferase superfamily protein [Desulfopila sp.]
MTSAKVSQSKNLLPQSFFHALCHTFPHCQTTAVLHVIDNSFAQSTHPDRHLNQWLDSKELQKLATFKLAKRRNEWLAGRICAKLAIADNAQESSPTACNMITIVNDHNGRPYVTNATGSDAPLDLCRQDISIAHSGSYAAAAASTHYCGIDIQEPRTTLERVKARFCTEDEEHILEKHLGSDAQDSAHHIPGIRQNTMRLNLLWAAKEAVRKCLSYSSIPGFLSLQLFDVEFFADQWHVFHLRHAHHINNQTDQHLRVLCGHYQEYALALTVEKIIPKER